MNWISNLMFAVILTNLTGSALSIVWLLFYFLFKESLDIRIIYKSIKSVMLGFLIPAFFIIRKINVDYFDYSMGYLMMETGKMQHILLILFFIWLAGLTVLVILNVPDIMRLRKICKNTVVASTDKRKQVEMLKKMTEVHKKVQLRYGYSIGVPFIIGVHSPTIYLPMGQYSDEYLDVILTHELCHCRQRDTFWKPAFTLACYIYWFNPLIWYVRGRMKKLAEASCDCHCCEKRYSFKTYFSALLQISEGAEKYISGFVPLWYENEAELKWRIRCMKKNPLRKSGKGLTVFLLSLLLLMEGVSVYAAGMGAEKLNALIYENTVVSTVEEVQPEPYFEEYTEASTVFDGLKVKREPDNSQHTIYTKSIDWKIPAKGVNISEAFLVSEKRDIYLAVTLDSVDACIMAGIIQPDGRVRYIYCSGDTTHTFKTDQDGSYEIFICNQNGTQIEVFGFYK